MAPQVTTGVTYISGMQYYEPAAVDKLVVYKTGEDTVRLEFQDDKGVRRGWMSVPDSSAIALARALLIVAKGYAPRVDVKLP
jgi:hypothetical protein